MAALYVFPNWAWWLIDSAFVLLGIAVVVVWGRRIMEHRIAYYGAMVGFIGALFVYRLLSAKNSLTTALTGVWLFFALFGFVSSILDARERSLK